MLKFIDIICGLVLIVYSLIINMLSNTRVAFSQALILIGVLLIIYHFIKERIKESIFIDKIIRFIYIFIALGLILFIVVEVFIIAYPKKSRENAEYIIVLGAGLTNGNEVSLTLKDRLDAAITCINDFGNDGYIVVSGGNGEDEDISEAEAMQSYLINKGIPQDKILLEDKSTTTAENIKFSKEVIEKHSDKSINQCKVKVVTTDFHALRSSILAKKNGYGEIEVYSSNTVGYLIPIFYIRESLAVVKNTIFD